MPCAQPSSWHSTKEVAMKQTLAFALMIGLAACSDEGPKLAPVSNAQAPKAATVEVPKPDPDKELAARVGRAIDGAKLPGIDVVAAEGVVTLWGSALSAPERNRAAEVARNVEGVKAVENRLEIVTGS